jgi:malonyl-CoA O-methyltransferase
MSTQKTQVRRAFSRSADSYDATATVQREIAGRLLAVLPPLPKPRRALDAGCGTGHGLSLLKQRWPESELLALDFSLPMLAKIQGDAAGFNYQRCCADVEAMPFAASSFDMLWSNLTLQWCDPFRFASEAARLLRPPGLLAVSTLGTGTFVELRRAFAGIDSYQHTTQFNHAEDIAAAIAGAGLRLTVLHQHTLIRHHPDMRSLLAEVRDIGASRGIGGGARRSGLMGKVAWHRFEDAIEAQRTPAGLPLSYETLLICAEK